MVFLSRLGSLATRILNLRGQEEGKKPSSKTNETIYCAIAYGVLGFCCLSILIGIVCKYRPSLTVTKGIERYTAYHVIVVGNRLL